MREIKRDKGFLDALIAKTCILIAIIACFTLVVTGCTDENNNVSSAISGQEESKSADESKPAGHSDSTAKTFSAEGMSITLTNKFKETKVPNYTVCYDSSKVAVITLKESFTLVEGFENYTLAQYGDMVTKNNGLTSADLKTTDGLTYFEYDFTNTEENKVYHYYSFVYKADDAFWLIQFATIKDDAKNHFDDIVGWAKSVKFS